MSARKSQNKDSILRPDIYTYHDYREFLRDWFEYLDKNFRISLRSISRKSKISIGYLPSVISGQLRLSDKALRKISSSLKLDRSEISYLEQLITLGEADTQQVRLEAFRKIQRFQSYRKKNPKEIEAYQYLSHWFYPVIREMSALKEFKLDPKWIQSRLKVKIPLDEVKHAVNFLTENGYLQTDRKGDILPPEKNIACFDGVFKLALGKFHSEMFANAADSIENTERSRRLIGGETMAVTQENLDEIKRILSETQSKIQKLASSERDAGDVYHVALAAFPLTKAKE